MVQSQTFLASRALDCLVEKKPFSAMVMELACLENGMEMYPSVNVSYYSVYITTLEPF